MATERNVVDFKIHNLTEEQFQELKAQGKIDPNAVYCTPDESLKTSQITNCITEIPQDIKLELANGVLTLKAGSKVYLATGDSSFPAHTTDSDIEHTTQNNGQYVVIRNSQTSLYFGNIGSCTSGKIADRPTSTPNASGLYFATDENKMYLTGNSGKDWYSTSYMTLPIAIITVSNGAISSIDQVFNGFGYIGGARFVLPGVDGLAPNGFNADGTYKSVKWTTKSVLVRAIDNTTGDYIDATSGANIGMGKYIYDPATNYVYVNTISPANRRTLTTYGRVAFNNGRVESYETKTSFHAVDYSEFETLSDTVKTNNNNAVHKTGDETIGGVKTFQAAPVSGNGGYITKTTYAKGGKPASVQYFWSNVIYDKNGNAQANKLSQDFIQVNQDGAIKRAIAVFKNTSSEAVSESIEIGYNAAGQLFTKAPTPAASDNSTNIATTAWVNAATVHKTGDETIAGTKHFTGGIKYGSLSKNGSYKDVEFRDTNGVRLGTLRGQWTEDGNRRIELFTATEDGSRGSGIGTYTTPDGKEYNTARTPDATSNTNHIATTAWVKNYGMGAPDYANKTQITSGATMTAKGWITGGKNTGDVSAAIMVNGFTVFASSTSHAGTSYGCVPVNVGDVVTTWSGTYYFVPCKTN